MNLSFKADIMVLQFLQIHWSNLANESHVPVIFTSFRVLCCAIALLHSEHRIWMDEVERRGSYVVISTCPVREHFTVIEKRQMFSAWLPCRVRDHLCSVSGIHTLVEISVVAMPTRVVSSFHGDAKRYGTYIVTLFQAEPNIKTAIPKF